MIAIFSGADIAGLLRDCGITHVVTVPDSTLGQWEPDIEAIGIRLVRVCREGEAWAIAAGLYLGGAGTHPGPGVLGGPGWLAARRLLAHRRRRNGAS